MGLTGFDWFGMVWHGLTRQAIFAHIITQQSHLAKISTSPLDDGRNRIYINIIETGGVELEHKAKPGTKLDLIRY